MHMADALVNPAVAGTMYACSTVAAGYSIKKLREEEDLEKKIPVMGVMGAFVFAAQMINFSIPGTGSSGHLCGGMMLSAILGPYAGFITMIGVLLIQCLFFADGGLLALGCNIWNMAFYGCFVGALLIWKQMMKNGVTKKKITIASIGGCIIALQLGAFSVTIETLLSGVTELPFTVFLAAMQPIHLAIGLVEGIITAAVLCFVYDARPELIWTGASVTATEKKAKLSYKALVCVLAVTAVLIGGGLSHLASGDPDGLEWSMEKVAGTTELEGEGSAYDTADRIVSSTAVLPDYGFSNSDSAAGTSVSGIVGGMLVCVLCAGVCFIIRKTRKKTV